MENKSLIRHIRRTASWSLYGSIVVVLLAVAFHFSPWHIKYQSEQVARWMLISGTVLAVLAVAMMLLSIRKTTPQLRQLDNLDDKIKGYRSFISNLYSGSAIIILIECVLIVLMSDTSLLMVTILMVLVLFISYPNMYKMKHDLGLTDEEMQSLFGDQYLADTTEPYASPDLDLADAQLESSKTEEDE